MLALMVTTQISSIAVLHAPLCVFSSAEHVMSQRGYSTCPRPQSTWLSRWAVQLQCS